VSATPRLEVETLSSLFYDSAAVLGTFQDVSPAEVPHGYNELLCHEEHMTVAMEAYHESLAVVEVLDSLVTDTHYARKILLRRQADNRVVQFGIPRIDLSCLSEPVRREIEEQRRPLGRILVRHNVLRTIHLKALWRVEPAEELCRLLEIDSSKPATTYGRTARIDFDGRPAVELLEIVAPLEAAESESTG